VSDDKVARILAGLPAANAANGADPVDDTSGTGPLLRRWTMAELLAEPDEFAWLVKGVLVDPTYGQTGGELKTLKSVITTFIAVSVASGRRLFDTFEVGNARPVVAYVGEGGRRPYRRRLVRIARAMDARLDDLPLEPVFEPAPILSATFQESLARDLRDRAPGLVVLDPLYMYHGTATRAADLHAEGALLGALSRPCMDAGSSLIVVNHFNQTGAGMNLKRITMAGSGEWADSWILLAHRVDPDVENGRFWLAMNIGSRQWGGTEWELDLDIGRFDQDRGEHVGEITWELRRAAASGKTNDRQRMLDLVKRQPFQLNREELVKGAGGKVARMRSLVDQLVEEGELDVLQGLRVDSTGRRYKAWHYGPRGPGDPTSEDGTSRPPGPPGGFENE
jgi:hypothetical protein